MRPPTYIFLLLTLVASSGIAQHSSTNPPSTDSSIVFLHSSVDRLARTLDSLRVQSAYSALLEKTNQQLSLWYNPFAVIISSLALLFTVLAIVATFIIFRQGAEYRKILDAAIADYRDVLNDFIADKKTQLDNIEQYFNKKIRESEEKLAGATGAQKELIEDTIEKLRVERDSVKSTVTSTTTAIPLSASIFGLPADRFHRCSKCGFGYIVKDPFGGVLAAAIGRAGGKSAAKCPSCGNVDEIQ